MNKKFVLLALVSVLLLSGFLPTTLENWVLRTHNVVVATIGEPESVDPAWAYDTASGELIFNVYDRLLNFDVARYLPPWEQGQTDEFVPSIATEWGRSSDGLRYTFKINTSVTFHNGAPLTPADIEYSFERWMVQCRTGGPTWVILERLLGVHKIRPDYPNPSAILNAYLIRNTVESNTTHVWFNLITPWVSFITILAQSWSSILNKDWCIANGDWPGTWGSPIDGGANWTLYNNPMASPLDLIDTSSPGPHIDAMCGTGPYYLNYWDRGTEYQIVRHQEYWGGWPAPECGGRYLQGWIETANVMFIPDWSTRKMMFLAGDTDFCYVPRMHIPELITNWPVPPGDPEKYPTGITCLNIPGGTISGAWYMEKVDVTDDVGSFTSIALDLSDRPHISYYDETNQNLKYAYHDGFSWHTETVDSGGDVGLWTSIALDSDGNPHISYYNNTNQDLKYAYHDGTSWNITTVDIGIEWFNSIAVDSDGNPHISYYDYPNLKYAHHDGTSWSTEIADGSGYVGAWNSIAVDSDGNPHISYYDDDNDNLKYVYHDGTSWTLSQMVDIIGDVGLETSIAVDTDGNPHISYYDNTNEDLKYAYHDGTIWKPPETVDSDGRVGEFNSIAVDSDGNPHISYHDMTLHDLKYAYYNGSSWHIETVFSEHTVGWYTSIAIDSGGGPHISHFDVHYQSLGYARRSFRHWERDWMQGYYFNRLYPQTIPEDGGHYFYHYWKGYIGDVNLDYVVDIFDLVRVALCYGTCDCEQWWHDNNCQDVDLNNDGCIDIFDLVICAGQYGC